MCAERRRLAKSIRIATLAAWAAKGLPWWRRSRLTRWFFRWLDERETRRQMQRYQDADDYDCGNALRDYIRGRR